MAEYLLKNETMDGEDFDYFCEHGTVPPKPEKPAEPEQPVGDEPQEAPEPEQAGDAGDAPEPGRDEDGSEGKD